MFNLKHKSSRSKWKFQGQVLACTAGLLVATASFAVASPESRNLVQQGVTELSASQFESALGKFQAAVQADATDAQAYFYEGVALNRLTRHQEALTALVKASTLGLKQNELAFEMGWALMKTGRYEEAIAQLEQYEATNPGRGQTSEFLGRSYLGMGEYDKADEYFAEALKRDPSLSPTVHFYQALSAERRNRTSDVNRNLETLLQESPNSPPWPGTSCTTRREWRNRIRYQWKAFQSSGFRRHWL